MNPRKKQIKVTYEPTAEEIREACLEIQSRWSNHERKSRAGMKETKHWSAPVVTSSSVHDALRDAKSNNSQSDK